MIQKREECNIVDNVEKNSYVKKQITNALLRLLKEKELKLLQLLKLVVFLFTEIMRIKIV